MTNHALNAEQRGRASVLLDQMYDDDSAIEKLGYEVIWLRDRFDEQAIEITALRAALDQERADCERLRAFAQDCEDTLGSDDEIQMLLNEHGLTNMDGVPTALLSGRREAKS